MAMQSMIRAMDMLHISYGDSPNIVKPNYSLSHSNCTNIHLTFHRKKRN
jgi:hypothetical protein